MMHALNHAMFPHGWRDCLAYRLRISPSRRFCSVLFVLALILGSASALHAATATWNPNPEPDIAGYILSYGTQPGVHPTSINVGNVTTWQLTTLTPGQTYYFVVQAYNTSALTSLPSTEVVFTAPVISPPPTAPTLTQPANQTSAENTAVSLQLLGSDPDGDVLTYSATGLPAALSVNAATGLISGTLPVGSAGTYSVSATVSDGSLTASKSFTWTVTAVTQAPIITSLSLTSGPVGTPVIIIGSNFASTQGTSTVTFNGTAAAPTSWSAISIVVPVPSGATTGPLVVTVGGTASNSLGFTVTVPAPILTSLTPSSGAAGTPVTISGSNFGSTQGTSTVTFNGTAAAPTSWSSTSIVVPVPSGATTGPLVVTVGGIASNSLGFTVSASAPSLTSLTPSSGAAGTPVTISGSNFGSTQGTGTVTFNGTAATPTSWSATSIVVPVPGGATTGPLVVTVGGMASNSLGFTVAASGAITLTQHGSIDAGGTSAALAFPSNNAAGNFIAVAVRSFLPNQTFTVSDSIGNVYHQAFTFNNNSDDTLALYYAQNIAAGPNTVTVAVSTASSIRFAILEYSGVATSNALDVTATSTLSNASPTSGNTTTSAARDLLLGVFATQSFRTFTAGTGYTIEEAVSAAPSTALMIEDATQAAPGTVAATASLNSSDLWGGGLAAFRPAASGSNSPPTLTQPVNQTSAENAAVSLQLVGNDSDGDALTYSATGLPPVLSVNAATGLISGTLTATSAGTYTVTATVSDGSLTTSKTFTWTVTVVTLAPIITGLSQTSGPVGTPVTISGSNFGSTQGSSTITFNGTVAAPTSWSSTSIVVSVPSGATSGPVVVTVGGIASNSLGFTVTVPAPILTSLTPSSGAAGTPVTISGSNFGSTRGASTVTFNGTAAAPTSWSATSIVVPVPGGATSGPVVVTVGGVVSNSLGFTVTVPAPILTSLTPSSGAAGTPVTISGSNFGSTRGASTVTFNGTSATPTSWSSTSIAVPVPSGATTGPVVVTVGGIASNSLTFTVAAPGAITLTQHGSIDAGGTSAALAFPSNNAAGNFIAVAVRSFLTNQTFTVSDSIGNVYHQAFTFNNNLDDTLALYYAQNIAGGPNTVTVAVSTASSIRFAILEYSGVAMSNALDVTATSALSNASPTSGNATTTTSGDLLLGVFATQSFRTFTAGTGYTIEEAVSAAPSTALMIEDATQAAAGPVAATASLDSSDLWGVGLAAFRAAASGSNSPPTLTQPVNQTSAENAAVSLQLVGNDRDGDALTYSATGLPPVVSVNAATGLISGTLTATSAGTYTVIATVSDGSLTSSRTFTWMVTNVNQPPTLTQPPNRTSARNATVSLQLVASDPDGDVLTYSATGLPASLTVNAATGLISGTLKSSSVGTYTVKATVSDGALSASQTFTWTVTNVTPVMSGTDFDGDGQSDLAVYRPSSGMWEILKSLNNYTTSVALAWGTSTDRPVPGDYDGDRKTDAAVYRPSNGTWYVLQSSTNYTTSIAFAWGVSTDLPVPGDYDGDGKTDFAIYRPSTGEWYVLLSSTGYTTDIVKPWGVSTDLPVPGDYDGDGKTDFAIYRPSTGEWYVLLSSSGYTTNLVKTWGASTDIPVPGDYDGDGKTDLAVYRPSTGTWSVSLSSTHFATSLVVPWGTSIDVPVSGDYDGDGQADLALFESGVWKILLSSTNYATSKTISWGMSTDVPLPEHP
jgi:hypothetical protein